MISKPRSSKGFTLIELLVVIAIIGILAALVLVALGNARDKANDARIKSNLGQLRTLAEVHYDGAGAAYTGFDTCLGGTTADCEGGIEDSAPALMSDTSTATGGKTIDVNASSSEFCISTQLKSDSSTYVCVDSSGQFAESTAATCGAAATACP